MAETYTTTIVDTIQETPDTITLRLEKPQAFDFLPGQFVTIDTKQFSALQTTSQGRKHGPRAYSIGSSPTRNYVDITVKKEEQGKLSPWVVDAQKLRKGDAVEIKGPFGNFTYNKGDVVLIAAGSGIVPIRAMLQYVIDKDLNVNATLLYSNKTRESTIYRDELDAIKKPNIQIFHTLTKEQWQGRTGRIDERMIYDCVPRPVTAVYICGPTTFTRDLETLLLAQNIPQKRIKKEGWG